MDKSLFLDRTWLTRILTVIRLGLLFKLFVVATAMAEEALAPASWTGHPPGLDTQSPLSAPVDEDPNRSRGGYRWQAPPTDRTGPASAGIPGTFWATSLSQSAFYMWRRNPSRIGARKTRATSV